MIVIVTNSISIENLRYTLIYSTSKSSFGSVKIYKYYTTNSTTHFHFWSDKLMNRYEGVGDYILSG